MVEFLLQDGKIFKGWIWSMRTSISKLENVHTTAGSNKIMNICKTEVKVTRLEQSQG